MWLNKFVKIAKIIIKIFKKCWNMYICKLDEKNHIYNILNFVFNLPAII